MKKLLSKLGLKKKLNLSDPEMGKLINGIVTRRAVLLALIEGKQK